MTFQAVSQEWRKTGEQDAPRLYQMVRELTTRAGLPMPSLHLIPQAQPNAFATGRSHDKSAVAVTQGILQLLSEDELRGVIAHELAHIRNRDVLIQSVAATIGGAITYLAYMLMWFGGDNDSPLGLVGSLAMVLLAHEPIDATQRQHGERQTDQDHRLGLGRVDDDELTNQRQERNQHHGLDLDDAVLALEHSQGLSSTDPARLFPRYLAAVEHLAAWIDSWRP